MARYKTGEKIGNGRAVLVTGTSSGIGAYVARQLSAEGWRVIATARTQEDLDALAADGLEGLHLDYADPVSIAACAEEVATRTDGQLYGLFNNGGYAQPGAVVDLPVDALRAQFETNVFGYLDLTNRLLPAMLRRGEGRIIIHSSVLGFSPMRWSGAYNASKFALEGLFLTMRNEIKSSGVHISLLQTGPVTSKIGENSMQHYHRWLEGKPTRHEDMYQTRLKELNAPSDAGIGRFRKEPDAVHARVVRALTEKSPKPRYFITQPTYLMGGLQRVLTSRAFSYVAGSGR
ncbi:MAG: SDR family NAD(P)-dependent oxidoreductase [Pseudomonadota bacterium]